MAANNLKHYSKALTEFGREYGVFDELLADLQGVSEKLNANLDIQKYLRDPQIRFDKKKQALQAVFQDFISERTYNFLLLLIKNKKLAYLDQIIESAKKISKEEENVLEAVIETAVPLESDQEIMIKQILTDKSEKQILIKNLINKELIGGIRINLGDIIIDSSVQGKIDRLKKVISELR